MSNAQNPFVGVPFGTLQGGQLNINESDLSAAQFAAQREKTKQLLAMSAASKMPMGESVQFSGAAQEALEQQRNLSNGAPTTIAPEAPKSFLGKLWERFESANTWVYAPSMVGMLSVFGLGGNVGDSQVLKRTQANWLMKPLHWVVDQAHWLDGKTREWGSKIADTVINKWGVKSTLGKAITGEKTTLWQGLKKVAHYNIIGFNNVKGNWFTRLLKTAGAWGEAASPAALAAIEGKGARFALKFSLRSILMGLGYAGPVGWLTLGITAGLTAFSALKWLFSSKKDPANEATANNIPAVFQDGTLNNGGPQFASYGPNAGRFMSAEG